MSQKYFGTDGIRGKVGEFPMTPDFVMKLGWAAGVVLAADGTKEVLVGKDTRASGYMLESALEAAKAGKWNRIVAVFQPHRFTRTNDLAAAFSDCFQDADEIVITGIYSAGEKAIPGVTGKLIADAVASKAIGQNVRYCEHREDLIVFLRELLVEGDLCLTLGAGDLTNIVDQLMGALEDGQ